MSRNSSVTVWLVPVSLLRVCGIVGVVGNAVGDRRTLADLRAATDSLIHRGPDGWGTWSAPNAPVAFGHRRLAVIDLDATAGQPMSVGDNDESTITFNGEIYNYPTLRTELDRAGTQFRTKSDTEVLLRLCSERGPLEALRRVRGMFAFAFYDANIGDVWLARDRLGEKPLYYTIQRGSLFFGSELRALRAFSAVTTTIDPEGVDLLMRRSCVGGAGSIYADVHKVRPGTALRVAASGDITADSVVELTFWDPIAEAAAASRTPFVGTLDDAANALGRLLGDSVKSATVSDVPLGAFLSGGIDSTAVVSQLVANSGNVKTFTIGFTDEYRSESDQARRIAHYLGTDHTDLTITSDELASAVPTIADIYDEPFADSSQIPTLVVSELARRDVTVALTGDGGDELFGGYPRYRMAASAHQWRAMIPSPVASLLARQLKTQSPETWTRLGDLLGRTPMRHRSGGVIDRVAKTVALLEAGPIDDVFALFNTGFWGKSIVRGVEANASRLPSAHSALRQMMLCDTVSYLPDDILTKVDRAAMSVSLETRVPFLSPEVFSFAHSLDDRFLSRGRDQKIVLKRLLAFSLPRELWDHPKRGFSIPLGAWLRGPLRTWAEDLISPAALSKHDLLDRELVASTWAEHVADHRDWGSQLWNILMFQSWYSRHHA